MTQGGEGAAASTELEPILEAHQLWLDSGGDRGQRANLESAPLEGADLNGANLRRARLTRAALSEANLRGADLREADLSRARVNGADFQHALLEGATLRDMDFREALGLSAEQFARTDLTGARLPDSLGDFAQKLAHIAEASRVTRPLLLFVLLSSVFALLTVLSTSDAALLTNAPSAVLPNLSTRIPAASLFWIAPVALLLLYGYTHFYLATVWDELAELPAVFADGTRLEGRVHPWLPTTLVSRREMECPERGFGLDELRDVIVILLVWWTVPIALVGFWWRYLPAHHWVTGLHVVLIALASSIAVHLYGRAKRVLKLRSVGLTRARWFRHLRRPHDRSSGRPGLAVLVGTLLSFGIASYAITMHPLAFAFHEESPRPQHVRWIVANIDEEDLSTRPSGWDGKDLARVEGAPLRGANMGFAYGHRTFLAKADLRGASLERAELQGADLRAALLEDASLAAGKLDQSDFSGACLRRAVMRCADLDDARFVSAYLGRAELQGTCAIRSDLSGAMLPGADLRHAVLKDANLEGAELLCFISKKSSAHPRIECANLEGAVLAGASLRDADLRFANLRGVDLRGADFENADLGCADLSGADLRDAKGLLQAQLDEACAVDATLPNGLVANACPKNCSAAAVRAARPVDESNPCFHLLRADRWPQGGAASTNPVERPASVRFSDIEPESCPFRTKCF